jgi:hypothetical protein
MALDEELEQTRSVVDLSLLTNSSGTRKIFEEEDPNPCHESTLRDQLGIQALLGMSIAEINKKKDDWSMTIQKLADLLAQILVVLGKSTKNDGGISHDLSRHPAVFPTLHSLLGIVTVFIYLGQYTTDTTGNLTRDASTFLEGSTGTVHPAIVNMMECLAHAASGSEATKFSLQECLFLL